MEDNGICMKDEEKRVNEIVRLIFKQLADRKLTPGEMRELEGWLDASPENRTSYERITKGRAFPDELARYRAVTPSPEAFVRLGVKERSPGRWPQRMVRLVSAAAACLLVIGFYFWRDRQEQAPSTERDARKTAVISLLVDNDRDSFIVGVNQVREINIPGVRKDSNVLVYDPEVVVGHPEVEYHTLQVGKGGEFQLTLSDGTRVWLNSESSLKYPKYFTGNTRDVELTGEGFFEVAPDERSPFRVNCADFKVDVLGTSFNISAYPGEGQALITLATGKLQISHKERKAVIHPDQQVVIRGDDFSVGEVDVVYYTTWMHDMFLFENESLEMIARKLTRWYGPEFVFEEPALKETRFLGALPKYDDISKVFELLEMTTDVQFIIQPKTISVMRKR